VRCGGGLNHRMGLGDAALIKDNHVAAAGGVAPAIKAVPRGRAGLPLEVECDDLDQVREALDAGAGLILLDNMGLAALRAAGLARGYRRSGWKPAAGCAWTSRAVAETAFDFVAVGPSPIRAWPWTWVSTCYDGDDDWPCGPEALSAATTWS